MEADVAGQTARNILTDFLSSSGEMGGRIKAFNWSATSIGAIETWSSSLQTALQILLFSKFPMQILWGTDFIQFYNDAYIPIAGNKHPTALGQRGEDCWKEVWDFAGPLLNQVMDTGTATWSEDQLLILHRNGYAEECYFTFSYTPIWEHSGAVGGIFIAVNETTSKILSERRERALRVEAQAARELAERANQLKDQFLAVLSHELRSPLSPIQGWATLMLSHDLDKNTMRRGLEAINRNARLQAQLIDDLLDVSRILSDKLLLDLAPVYLIPIIEAALETVQATASAKKIRIQTRLDDTRHQILGDSNRLKQAFWNLLSNAVKFTPTGGQVTIQLDYVGSWARFQVIDTGKGITADFLPQVFEHFQQADSATTRAFGGLGLGLAIAKHVVDRHGGTIHAASPGDGQGATFTITLPLTADPPQPDSLPEALFDNAALQSLHVLLVEDDADNRQLIAFTLELYGAKVTAVASALDAIEAILHHQPDVLISDLGLPKMDGYMLIRHLRSLAATSQIPAIALTAYTSEADQQQAIAAGFQDHVPKPMEPATLIETVLKVVKAHQDNCATQPRPGAPGFA